MLDTDQTYALDYADGKEYDMDLNMQKTRMIGQHSCQTTKELEPLRLNMIKF